MENIRSKLLKELYNNKELLNYGNEPEEGSDSEPSGDNMSEAELAQILPNLLKNK